MDAGPPIPRTLRVCIVVLVCLTLLAGCVEPSGPIDTSAGTATPTAPDSGSQIGEPVTDYETHVFDLGPSSNSVIQDGIEANDEFDEQYYVTILVAANETDRFNRSLLPADASEFVDAVSFEDQLLVVIQTFPASSVPDYRVEMVARDGPTLLIYINGSSNGGTDDVTVETVFVRVPGDTPDNVIVTTEEGATFEIGRNS